MGGAERMWHARDAGELARGGYGIDAGMHLRAEAGYGFEWFRGRGAMAPFVGMKSGQGARDLRLGVQWTRGDTVQFGVEATRRESAWAPPESGVQFGETARW